jgi:hypothetical protein
MQNVNSTGKPVSVSLMEQPVIKPGTPQSEAIDYPPQPRHGHTYFLNETTPRVIPVFYLTRHSMFALDSDDFANTTHSNSRIKVMEWLVIHDSNSFSENIRLLYEIPSLEVK